MRKFYFDQRNKYLNDNNKIIIDISENIKDPIDWKDLTSQEIIDHILGLDKMGLEAKLKKLKGRDNSALSLRKADPRQHNPQEQYEGTEIVPSEIKYIDI